MGCQVIGATLWREGKEKAGGAHRENRNCGAEPGLGVGLGVGWRDWGWGGDRGARDFAFMQLLDTKQ